MNFKDKLKALRVERGISQEKLADVIHVSRSAIAKYENGNGKPSKDTLEALARYFNVDTDELDDDLEVKKINNKKAFLLISSICGGLLVVFSIIAVVLYNKAKFMTSGPNIYAIFMWLALIFLMILGVILLSAFIISIAKHNCRKAYLIVFLSTISVSLAVCLSGFIVTNSKYKNFAEFTVEKWADASNNHDYRGVMINSFLEKYNIMGYHTDAIEVLLGNPDSKANFNGETYSIHSDAFCYIYDLGYYEDFMDPTTFEITFNSADCVASWVKVHH